MFLHLSWFKVGVIPFFHGLLLGYIKKYNILIGFLFALEFVVQVDEFFVEFLSTRKWLADTGSWFLLSQLIVVCTNNESKIRKFFVFL